MVQFCNEVLWTRCRHRTKLKNVFGRGCVDSDGVVGSLGRNEKAETKIRRNDCGGWCGLVRGVRYGGILPQEEK